MTTPTADPIDQVAQAVQSLMPGLRQLARAALVWMGAALVVTLAAAVMVLQIDPAEAEVWKGAGLIVILGVAVILFLHRRMHRHQEMLVMPVLAAAVGLSYAKDAQPYLKSLPDRLLPKGIRKAEDHVSGQLGAHRVQLAEISVVTGGKNSRTLFKGIVAQFPNRAAMPAFFLAPEDKTRPGFFFGGDLSTKGLEHAENVTGASGTLYGIWTSGGGSADHPALGAVVKVLTGIETQVGDSTSLYAATSNGVEMHLALSLKRNLFHVGGLFPDEADIFADVRTAVQDLSVPLTLAKALIEAEEVARPKPEATPH